MKNNRIIQKKLLRICLFPLILILSLLFTQSVFAKIVISDYPQKIEVNKEFTVEVKLSGLKSPVHFLSIAIKKKNDGNNFGQTNNGGNWIEAEKVNCKNFPRIEVKEGSWSGQLIGRVIFGEKDYDNTLGDFSLKVIKYTELCNETPSEDLLVTLFSDDPPPTNAPTVTSTPVVKPTVKPTHTPKTSKPTVTKEAAQKTVATAIVTAAPSKTISQAITNIIITNEKETTTAGGEIDKVLGSEKTLAASYHSTTSRIPIIILILSGLIFIGGGVFLSIKKINKNSGKSDLFP